MRNYELPIETVIARLGYKNSENLVYYSEFNCSNYTNHIAKVVSEIKPYAIYFIDGKPFILFLIVFLMKLPLKQLASRFGTLRFLLLSFVMTKQSKFIMECPWICRLTF